MATKTGPTLADIQAARERVGEHARLTAVYHSEALSLRLQTAGTTLSAHLLHTLPYVTCLVVFVATCVRERAGRGAPAGLRAVLAR